MAADPSVPAGRRRRPILLISQDVFLLPRLQDAAAALNFSLVVLEGIEPGVAAGAPADDERMLTEPLSGPDAWMVRQVAELQPSLILLDLGDPALPAMRWLQRLKTSAATRRLPVVAFGPHVEKEHLLQARQHGADLVVTRSRLHTGVAEILLAHALPDPTEALRAGCDRPLSERAAEGLALLARGEYFEAHEVLERAWLEAEAPQRSLCRALVQTCVIYLHLERGNRPGAAKLLLRIHQWLDPLPDRCSGLDVAAWKANLQTLRRAMDDPGKASSPIDPALFRSIPKLEA
jgi:CheY-like chemotaxis protein